jgi:raffinose/stachyose/melibiose transport system substrate-binding protein
LLKAKHIVPLALGNGESWPGVLLLWAYQNRFGGMTELAAVRGSVGAGRSTLSFATAAGFKRAARAITDLGASRWLPLGYNGITGSQKYALFTAGNAAIIYQGPWLLPRIAADAPPDFKFGVFKFPSFKDGNPDSQQDLVVGFDALYVNGRTTQNAAIAAFLNSFADPGTALSFVRETQSVSVIKTVLSSGTGPGILSDILKLTASAPHLSPWWDNYLSSAVTEETMRTIQGLFDGSMSPDAFLAGLDKAAGR